jgi:hypothetical protein
MPATTVSLRSFAAAGIWLASLAGVIPLLKCRRRWRQKKMPPRRRATLSSEQARTAFVWFLTRAVVWTKVLPHQLIALSIYKS